MTPVVVNVIRSAHFQPLPRHPSQTFHMCLSQILLIYLSQVLLFYLSQSPPPYHAQALSLDPPQPLLHLVLTMIAMAMALAYSSPDDIIYSIDYGNSLE